MSNNNQSKQSTEIMAKVRVQPVPVYTYPEKYDVLQRAAQRALDDAKKQ